MTQPRHVFSPGPLEDRLEVGHKRLGWLKGFAGAAAALLAIGASAALWSSQHATRADVEQVRAPMGALRSDVRVLETRTGVVERSLDKLEDRLELIHEQLLEIARVTGARQVAPAPAPTEGTTP